jgi:hypothetical protein
MLYHMGARNFECKICGNKFFQMEHLKRHMHSIHNVTNIDSTNTNTTEANTSISSSSIPANNSPVKKSFKSSNQLFKAQIKSTVSSSSEKNLDVLFDSQRTRTLDNKETIIIKAPDETVLNQHPNQHSNMSSVPNNTFKVDLSCLFKCQQCEFSSDQIFLLNEHAIDQHFKEGTLAANETTASNSLGEDREDEDDDELNEEFEEYQDAFCSTDGLFSKESRQQKFGRAYPCAFCVFKTNDRFILKKHLQNQHASQVVAPVLLANDALMTHPNTRFQKSINF